MLSLSNDTATVPSGVIVVRCSVCIVDPTTAPAWPTTAKFSLKMKATGFRVRRELGSEVGTADEPVLRPGPPGFHPTLPRRRRPRDGGRHSRRAAVREAARPEST